MKALKCITLGRAIGMMTDSTVVRIDSTVVRIEALYGTGYLEFTTLVVHNTQGMVVPCIAAYMLPP